MSERQRLAACFETHRTHLHAIAYRMLGSAGEADDAVQEAWLRLHRTDVADIENLGGWLTTVVARICLDMLRTRAGRREDHLDVQALERISATTEPPDHELLLADSVGLALLVVLDRLAPAERVAFVLHDMFDLSFEAVAAILARSPAAARQLASRARRRLRDREVDPDPGPARRREVVDAFLAASRGGDLEALLAVLAPNVVFRADAVAAAMGGAAEMHGAPAVANAFKGRARGAQPALVDGAVGLLVAPGGRLRLLLRFVIRDGWITEIEAIADPGRLRQIDVAVLDG